MRTLASALALAAALGLAAPASAHDAGDWLFRFGGSLVDPKSNNGTLDLTGLDLGTAKVTVEDQWGVTFNITYMYTRNIGVELLAALPYKHDIKVEGDKVGSVKHLPPTLSLQYHFLPDGAFQPYAGVGVNWTLFSSDKATGEFKSELGGDIDVDSSSFGFAAQVGFDYILSDRWFLNVDVRYIDIGPDVKVSLFDGEVALPKTKVDINPMVYGIHLGYRF